jgi:hypothetical protein
LHEPSFAVQKTGARQWESRAEATRGWAQIMKALAASEDPEDRKLAQRVTDFVRAAPFVKGVVRQRQRQRQAEIAPRQQTRPEAQAQRHIVRPGPDRARRPHPSPRPRVARESLPPDGLRGWLHGVRPAPKQHVGWLPPVKGSLRRAMPALDRDQPAGHHPTLALSAAREHVRVHAHEPCGIGISVGA